MSAIGSQGTHHRKVMPETVPGKWARVIAGVVGAWGLVLLFGEAMIAVRDFEVAQLIGWALAVAYCGLAILIWRHGAEYPVRWAWFTAASAPITVVGTAMILQGSIAGAMGLGTFDDGGWTAAQYLAVFIPSFLVGAVAPAIGTALGMRATRAGAASGRAATVVNGLILLSWATWAIFSTVTGVVETMG